MLEIIDSLGVVRTLGNLVPTQGLAGPWPVYGDAPRAPMVPRSSWPELVARYTTGPDDTFLGPVHNQRDVGMCNPSATCSAIERCRARQGLEQVLLSGGDLYGRINGGVDRGSLLEDGLREAMAGGVAPVSEVPYLEWRGASRDRPSRRRFRVLEAWLCPTFAHCYSAVLSGFDLISGVMWYENYVPGPDGRLPRGRGQSGGHAIHGYKPAMVDGVASIWHKQSWGLPWGVGGCFLMDEDDYAGPVGGWWAVRAVTTEPGDVPAPKGEVSA